MKINYTLPGYQPETDAAKDLVDSFDSPFKNRMQAFERRQSVSWRDLLGLNQMPPDPAQIPAPESSSVETATAAILRQQWRELLSRHSGRGAMKNTPVPVRRMLSLLERYQKEADHLFSYTLSEGQE